ncbi:MAG: hypothetical protein QHH17_08105, partial [Candidatus Bathyarchaeota archaeon]|nr:hypothetical protein [Candidatus Bathyarchaeota archaeon]
MEEKSIKLVALICALLIFSPPFVNVGLQQLQPKIVLCLHERTIKTFEIGGTTHTIPINKTYIVFRNGTKIYNAYLETELVKINYTKVMPSQGIQSGIQSSSITPMGELVRDWYDGLLFIYDCPLNSIYYPHPDHYYTYPDPAHLMCWNYPWNITGDTMNNIHITQDEISEMKKEG